jgi:hypothetical protein
MATDLKLIELAREVTPSEALHPTYFHDRPSGLMVLSENELRKKVEWQRGVTRPMTWEEWLDVRESWCRYYDAEVCTIVQGDTTTMGLSAEVAAARGAKYILLDVLRPTPPTA